MTPRRAHVGKQLWSGGGASWSCAPTKTEPSGAPCRFHPQVPSWSLAGCRCLRWAGRPHRRPGRCHTLESTCSPAPVSSSSVENPCVLSAYRNLVCLRLFTKSTNYLIVSFYNKLINNIFSYRFFKKWTAWSETPRGVPKQPCPFLPLPSAGTRPLFRPCLVPKRFCKIFQISRHIKSLDACMKY